MRFAEQQGEQYSREGGEGAWWWLGVFARGEAKAVRQGKQEDQCSRRTMSPRERRV